jgi:membrane-associated phospholipid phosphatase
MAGDGGDLRLLKNIAVLMAWLVGAWLMSTAALAAPRPQDSDQQNGPAPTTSAVKPALGEASKDKESPKEMSKETPSAGSESYDLPAASNHGFHKLASDFFFDQKEIWTSPAKLRLSDTQWLFPLSGITAGLFVTDRDFSKHLSQSPGTISHYKTLSNAGVGALIGGGAGMWLLGHVSHNEHWSETGFLAGEAALNSLVVVESMKYSLQRERPYQGNGSGSFFQGGTSFPSEHAAAAWAIAGVVAHEYPGPLTKIFVYGLASLVDVSRLKAHQHFPSDVLVGSMIGNLVAQNIYTRHHDPELGGEAWRSISQVFRGDGTHSRANQGSPYVPLDSWIYPAMDRLAAMGLIDSGFAAMRPWTRNECARLLGEAEDKLGERTETSPEVQGLLSALEKEFRTETEAAGGGQSDGVFRVESLYTRTEHISGMPLTDGYDFAQTQYNDFGRPYGEGWNSVTGFSSYTTWGSWAGYVRGELQTAPSVPALPLSARQFVAASDGYPSVAPGTASPSVQRFDLLEAYAGLTFDNWAISFGKQSLDWGPGDGGAFMLSNNAEPINMLRIDRVSPFVMPSFLKFLGPVRMEVFVGQVAGHHFVNVLNSTTTTTIGTWLQPLSPQPLIDGAKFSFKPSSNLDIGLTYGTMFGGAGVPATLHSFAQALFNTGELPGGRSLSIRWNTLDFAYRIPKLRRWLTLYGEGIAEDQFVFFIDQTASPLPFGYPDRAVWRAGIYVPKFPGLSKLDFRVEGVYTDNPNVGDSGNISDGYYYRANRYLNGFTNNGILLGSWVGRQGQGAQAWTNYWFSPRTRIQLNFRHQKVSQQFVPGGGTLTDVGARADYWPRSNLGFSASVQHERWLFPIIQPGAERNVAATLEIQFQPQKLFSSSMFRLAPKDAGGDDKN